MKGKGTLWRCDSLRHLAWLPRHDRVVLPDVPHFFCLFLAFLLLSFLLSHRLHPALLDGGGVLRDLQALPLGHDEAALGGRARAERMDPVLVLKLECLNATFYRVKAMVNRINC